MSRLLGYVSIVANLALGLFCLGLGVLGWAAGQELDIGLVPLDPEQVGMVLALSGIFALAAVVLAFSKNSGPRFFLLLWSLIVSGILIAAFFRASYRFDGMEGLKFYGWCLLGSLVALLGSWLHFRGPRRRREY